MSQDPRPPELLPLGSRRRREIAPAKSRIVAEM